MDMLESVKKALRLCSYDPDPYDDDQPCKMMVSCEICPYWDEERGCRETDLFNDALKLLDKLDESEPKVLTLDEVKALPDKSDVWLDEMFSIIVAATVAHPYDKDPGFLDSPIKATYFYGIDHTNYNSGYHMNADYGKYWRCWNARPTNEQREATPWRN